MIILELIGNLIAIKETNDKHFLGIFKYIENYTFRSQISFAFNLRWHTVSKYRKL